MIRIIGTNGEDCVCGRIRVELVDELGRYATACFGCRGARAREAVLAARAALETPTPVPLAVEPEPARRRRKYKPRRCTKCLEWYAPTGSRGVLCVGCS